MIKKKTSDAVSRSDAVLIAALAIVLATASAAIGSAMTYHPLVKMQAANAAAAATPMPAIPVVTQHDSVATRLLTEHRCLSEVLYFEARGEGRKGQQAIAEVVFHRMNTGNYGHSICAVVYEGAGHSGCQFSFTCNGDLTHSKQSGAWRDSEVLAAQILTGEVPLRNATAGATNFHAVSVAPEWADAMNKTTQIGNHIFYRGGVIHRDS